MVPEVAPSLHFQKRDDRKRVTRARKTFIFNVTSKQSPVTSDSTVGLTLTYTRLILGSWSVGCDAEGKAHLCWNF